MTKSDTKRVGGMYNSSITRVRPFFRTLFKLDKKGESWLPDLLRGMPLYEKRAEILNLESSPILDECLQKKEFIDKILHSIDLENCFEYRIPPSKGFLKWGLDNPDLLTWPENGKKEFGSETQFKRECLFGQHGEDLQKLIKEEGINLLESEGVYRSSQQWWAFEGFTEMDCLIETEKYLLGIEGKRTEFVSASTYWFQDRNQIARNLESLKEFADEKNKDYAFILLTENGQDPITKDHFIKSLPHDEKLANELFSHYLGCLSWEDACKATNISNDCLLEDIRYSKDYDSSADQVTKELRNDIKEIRIKDYKLLRIHGKMTPQKDNYEAKLRNDLFMVGSLNVRIGKDKYRRIRLIGYEVPLYHKRDECIDLLGYDEGYNLYIIELKINNSKKPHDVSKQLERYYEAVTQVVDNIAQEVRTELFLNDFSFSGKTIKLALIPKDCREKQWDKDILVCSIEGKTKIDKLIENRSSKGFVSLDIVVENDAYSQAISNDLR